MTPRLAAFVVALLVATGACTSPVTPTPSGVLPSSATNTATPTQTLAPNPTTVDVGGITVTCVDVDSSACKDVAAVAISNLGRGVPPDGVMVAARPVCPVVPDWADGSFCWQARFVSTANPLCMVIAERPTLGGYGQVGGPIPGRAGLLPAGWPDCS